MYTVEIYTDKSGKSPYTRWLESLDSYVEARIDARIDRLRLGNLGDTKSVGDGVHELRLQFGPGYRIYFGNVGKEIVLLLTGGDKSSQERDIAYAKELFENYKKSRSKT